MSKSNRLPLILIVLVPMTLAFGALLYYPTLRKPAPTTGSEVTGIEASSIGDVDVGLHRVFSPQIERLDPKVDGWDTEKLGEIAKKTLKKLGSLLENSETIDSSKIPSFLASEFSCGSLRPRDLKEVFNEGAFRVLRSTHAAKSETRFDSARWHEALRELLAAYDQPRDLRTHFKVYRVENHSGAQDSTFQTVSFFEASATTASGSVQQNAVWRCDWVQTDSSESGVLLSGITVDDYEEVVLTLDSNRLFSDCTEAVFGQDPAYQSQLAYSQMYWSRRLPARLGLDIISHNGLAIGDANGDGLEDVYACQTGGLPNLLLIHQKDGTVVDAAKSAGLDLLDRSRTALFGDFDNDGDQDLVVALPNAVMLYLNQGNLKFTETYHSGQIEGVTSVIAGDFDNDSLLDLFVCVYPGRSPFPYEDAQNGEPNLLLRNLGNGKFENVSEERGFLKSFKQYSFAAAWEDFDNDGDLDLYIANDYGRNNLFRNDGGRFVDVAAQAGVEDIAAGMSVTWGDYNSDGWMDIYVSNMFSAAGNRVAYQRKFRDGEPANDDKDLFRRHARGNSLFVNNGDGTFVDASVEAGVTMGRWSWSSLFTDLNNDGLEDLLVSNGYLTAENPDDL